MTGRYAKCRALKRFWVSSVSAGGVACRVELYRQLFNPQLYLLAYGRLYSNQGAMTPGADGETVDGTSLAKIERTIGALRRERYRFKPARRISASLARSERASRASQPNTRSTAM
jgi:hypothetical protein